MASDIWHPVEAALDRAAASGRIVQVWLRDDDAVTRTAALDRLMRLARDAMLPVLLAVIPSLADRHLAQFLAAEPLVTPTQHGFAHTNHAEPPQRACELDGMRPPAVVLGDIARGRDRMDELFGTERTDILVPPWNRIASELLPHLPGLGFGALSTFGTLHEGSPGLDILNCDLDIIDWRHGRVCRPEATLIERLAALIDAARPIGLLTHHLVHDEAAWRFLKRGLSRLAAHTHVRFVAADALRPRLAHLG